MSSHNPSLVIILCGKRKCGKDYIASILQDRFGQNLCCILRLSAPLKQEYAREHGLDFEKLLDSSEYKEIYREDMIKWGEERRTKNNFFFIDLIIQSREAQKPLWIISDARRTSDIDCLKERYHVITIRISASDEVRTKRGWVFTKGVDDVESECGLDTYKNFDFHFINNDQNQILQDLINLIKYIKKSCSNLF